LTFAIIIAVKNVYSENKEGFYCWEKNLNLYWQNIRWRFLTQSQKF